MRNGMMNDTLKGAEIYSEMVEKMNGLSYATFFSTVTVLIEEYCKNHGLSPIDEIGNMEDMVAMMRDLLGPM